MSLLISALTCPPVTASNNSIASVSGRYAEMVEVVCEEGYQLPSGEDKNLSCQEDGSWTALPECQRM